MDGEGYSGNKKDDDDDDDDFNTYEYWEKVKTFILTNDDCI